MLHRISMIFTIETEAADRSAASPHVGGWSESFWGTGGSDFGTFIDNLAAKRARMLPKQATIVGFRLAEYTMDGNHLVPGGTQSRKVRLPGVSSIDCDLPQVSVQLSLAGANGNTSRASLRGIPDSVMVKGEYQPDANFKDAMTRYLDEITGATWGFVGRDLTKPAAKIVSISAAGLAKLRSSTTGGGGDYVRCLRVKDDNGRPVKGTFRIETVTDGGKTVQLENWPAGITVTEKGSLRVDAVDFVPITIASVARAVVRKIGSPSERYRGRASKKAR